MAGMYASIAKGTIAASIPKKGRKNRGTGRRVSDIGAKMRLMNEKSRELSLEF
jgi:hypothetical protein